jgi:hypothetical protein
VTAVPVVLAATKARLIRSKAALSLGRGSRPTNLFGFIFVLQLIRSIISQPKWGLPQPKGSLASQRKLSASESIWSGIQGMLLNKITIYF